MSRKERGHFKLESTPIIEGVTPEILYDLWDLARKWGDIIAGMDTVEVAINIPGLGYGVGVATPLRANTGFRLIVSKDAVSGSAEFFRTKSGIVLWDRDLTAQEAKRWIQAMDGIGRRNGWFRGEERKFVSITEKFFKS